MSNDESGALARFGVTDREIEQALGRVKVSTVDYADLYFEYCQSESVSMEEGIVKRATKSVGQGVGAWIDVRRWQRVRGAVAARGVERATITGDRRGRGAARATGIVAGGGGDQRGEQAEATHEQRGTPKVARRATDQRRG